MAFLAWSLLQIDDALKVAERDWTTVTLAVFCLVSVVLMAAALYWHQQKIIKHLAGDKSQQEKGWREDLQHQIEREGERAARVEGGLQTAATAVSANQDEVKGLREDVQKMSRILERGLARLGANPGGE